MPHDRSLTDLAFIVSVHQLHAWLVYAPENRAPVGIGAANEHYRLTQRVRGLLMWVMRVMRGLFRPQVNP